MQNLILRTLSGIILVCVFFLPLLSKALGYSILLLTALAMIFEWTKMTQNTRPLLGGVMTLVPSISLCLITYFTSSLMFLMYFCLLWSVDVFAFVGGKILQGPKLIPKVSPNKTWSGLVCAVVGCCTTLHLMMLKNNFFALNLAESNSNLFLVYELLFGVIFALLAQTGDLFVSFYKRKFGVKHTGNFIPGHGGVLDRFDGIIFTAPFALFIMSLVCLSSK